MSLDGSFVGAFDLTSQAGVTAVLAAIRASQLTPAEKNELRDLVFMYTNGGGDASVRIALEQKLGAHQIVPIATAPRGATSAPTLEFGTYRPTPSFKAPVVEVATSVPPQPVPVTSQPAPVPPPAAPDVPPAPAFVPPPVQPQPAPAPAPAVPPPPVVSPTPAPVPPPAAPVVPPASSSPNEAAYLERIRQIKTAVNSKVGNPVNLVDINNEVGREYMNALLEAMKKLGSGAVSEMGAAMQRLETAYVAVEAAIKQHEAGGGAVPGPTTPPPSPNPPPVYTPPAAPVVPPAPAFVPPPVVPPAPAPVVPPAAPVAAPAPVAPRQEEVREAPAAPSGFADSAATPVAPRPVDVPGAVTPAPSAVPTPVGEKIDPLYNREVDEGLDQLLSDWSLFKKSGLFGTGPKGREHPLYKKISDLQVPLLLAGRFDGATQDIRQSITDYMNGWRYEQGIIYQPGETFEKYLRRVIKHILDLQKKRHHA